MASAGQAQAHSSQPMHFSSPSGQRLSWWRPWKRGAVGFTSSGYWTVYTFLNMVRKVTPNPLTESNTGDLLGGAVGGGHGIAGATGGRRWLVPGTDRDAGSVVVRKIHGRDGETPQGRARRTGRTLRDHSAHGTTRGRGDASVGFGLRHLPPPLRGHVAQEDEQDDEREDEPGHDIDSGAPAILAVDPYGGDDHDPGQRDRDEHLPAEPHQLVVADPRQRAAQPEEHEDQDQHLGQEPEHRPPAAVRPRPHRQRPGRAPATEEERRGEPGDRRHVDVLGQLAQCELERGVLGVVAANYFAVALGQVER